MKNACTLILIFITSFSFGQTNPSDYVEGGKVVLEFAKLFKSNKNSSSTSDCAKLNLGDIEFINNLKAKVSISIVNKVTNKEVYNVVIPKKKTENLYDIPVNVYHCIVIKNESGEVIKKGDIRLEKCKTLKLRIQE